MRNEDRTYSIEKSDVPAPEIFPLLRWLSGVPFRDREGGPSVSVGEELYVAHMAASRRVHIFPSQERLVVILQSI